MTEILNILNITFSVIVVLFLPGLAISFIFFDKKQIDIIERIALSFALSIAVVPLLVFYLNLIGVKITKVTVLLDILAIVLVSLLLIYFKGLRNKK